MYTYYTQFNGLCVIIKRLCDNVEILLQGDEATLAMADFDAYGIDAVANEYFINA